jgi:hypothetical protein
VTSGESPEGCHDGTDDDLSGHGTHLAGTGVSATQFEPRDPVRRIRWPRSWYGWPNGCGPVPAEREVDIVDLMAEGTAMDDGVGSLPSGRRTMFELTSG